MDFDSYRLSEIARMNWVILKERTLTDFWFASLETSHPILDVALTEHGSQRVMDITQIDTKFWAVRLTVVAKFYLKKLRQCTNVLSMD